MVPVIAGDGLVESHQKRVSASESARFWCMFVRIDGIAGVVTDLSARNDFVHIIRSQGCIINLLGSMFP